MIFRLYTEDKNRKKLLDLCSTYFDGFTVVRATGYWKGKGEQSLIIEIVALAPSSAKRVNRLAKDIKELNGQESVLITETDSRNRLA